MNEVYFLYHIYKEPNTKEEISKILGVFSSQEEIDKAIKHYRNQEGFCKYPDDFVVEIFTPDNFSDWNEGFVIGKDIPIWAENLEINNIDDVKKICKEHNLNYRTAIYSEYQSLIRYTQEIAIRDKKQNNNSKKIYYLRHYYQDKKGEEFEKVLGVFNSLKLAQ
ncbi:MAG: hypothetical protein IJ566_03860 [Cardiobacteriaceae bacterium]|nr:hypothetical protein [Cardiobacteriaceae bacterium]